MSHSLCFISFIRQTQKGIPFPNAKDPAMNAKKAYNDKYDGQAGKISGKRWYEIQVRLQNSKQNSIILWVPRHFER